MAGLTIALPQAGSQPRSQAVEANCFENLRLYRFLLLTVCILAVVQYGFVLTNGVSAADFNSYYHLDDTQGQFLYSCLNFGACALCFIPGLIYDRLGAISSILLGLLIFNIAVLCQLYWTPLAPGWDSSFGNLAVCFLCFGYACTTFNVVGSIAPMMAFSEGDVGKVSTVVSLAVSLGITVHSSVYQFLRDASPGRIVIYELVYSFAFTNLVGLLMCGVFWKCGDLFSLFLEVQEAELCDEPGSPISVRSVQSMRPLRDTIRTPEFIFMLWIFFVAIGFSFSFLNCEGALATEVGISASSLAEIFGVLNAIGRLLVGVPLDYTRHHPLGGVYSYIFASLVALGLGMLCLALPAEPGPSEVYVANALVAIGYGGLMGIVPPALRIFFGTSDLGVIYGLLYFGVSLSVPLWSFLFTKVPGCVGVGCYRAYTLGSVLGLAATGMLTLRMLYRDAMARSRFVTCDYAKAMTLAPLLSKCETKSGDTALPAEVPGLVREHLKCLA